jgi:alanine racemase
MSKFYRPTWVEIDLSTIQDNYRNIRNYVGEKSKIIAVVKANAYGMGLVPTVKALHAEGCRNFAVATPDEALELRDNDCLDSILLIGPATPSAAPMLIEYDIETVCGDDSFLNCLNDCARYYNKCAFVHFKIDTGMGRSGFLPEEFIEKIPAYSNMNNIKISGILSHFAVADEGPNEYTELQYERFSKLLKSIGELGIDVGCRHICNSAATVSYPHMHLDAVRVGKLLYGFWPDTNKPFQSKFPFKVRSEITSIRKHNLGTSFGYGLRYAARDNDLIAIAPIGYADGYSRMYFSKSFALVRGQRVPVVAGICCDQIFLRVTEVPEVSIGDEVVLLGKQGDEEIRPEELGSYLGTSACEAFSLFRGRIPRVYLSR